MRRLLIFLLLILLRTVPAHAQAAFIGAEGAGAVTAGGRGGTIIRVTNLNNSGAGSVRNCLEGTGTRICICDVGGAINTTTQINVDAQGLTFYGQTCPGGGLAIHGASMPDTASLMIRAPNIVIQYLSLRQGANASRPIGSTGTNIYLGGTATTSANSVILDHISMSWSSDENMTFRHFSGAPAGPQTITTSWSLLAESFSTSIAVGSATTPDGTGTMTNLDFHHNLQSSTSHRHPHYSNKLFRFVNNLTYNYGFRAQQADDGVEPDVINNVWKAGPWTTGGIRELAVEPDLGEPANASGTPLIYFTGNKGPNHTNPDTDGWNDMVWEVTGFNGPFVGILNTIYKRVTPHPAQTYPITATHANSVESLVLDHVGNSRRLDCAGNWVMRRDAVDTRLINEYNAGTGISAAIDHEDDVGGFPTIGGGTACTDTDGGGVPDTWETNNGLNPASAADDQATVSSGVCATYTNLDCYMAGLQLTSSKPIVRRGAGVPK